MSNAWDYMLDLNQHFKPPIVLFKFSFLNSSLLLGFLMCLFCPFQLSLDWISQLLLPLWTGPLLAAPLYFTSAPQSHSIHLFNSFVLQMAQNLLFWLEFPSLDIELCTAHLSLAPFPG